MNFTLGLKKVTRWFPGCVHIKLYAPINSTQKLKLMGRAVQFTYIIFQRSPSRRASLGSQTWNRSEQQLFYLIALARIRTRNIWLWYHIKLHAPTNSNQKLKLIGGGQFTYIIFQQICLGHLVEFLLIHLLCIAYIYINLVCQKC